MTPEQIAALTQERDQLKPQVAALTTQTAALTQERDGLKTQVTALTQERDALATEKTQAAAAADQQKHTELLQAALTDGRLAPAQKEWAQKQSLAALTEYLSATAPLVGKDRQAKTEAGATGLSEVELAACTRMGVSAEEFIKNRDPAKA